MDNIEARPMKDKVYASSIFFTLHSFMLITYTGVARFPK